jgi:glycosyltransferase involved in cell wall biosynthesis
MIKHKKSILIITPGLNGLGGVANYYKTMLPLLENERFSTAFLETGSVKGKGNLFYPITDQINCFKWIKKKPDLVHINPSLDLKSFIRDGALIYQAVRKNIPVVVFFHGWDVGFAQVIEKYFLKFFNATYGKASAFIVLASEFKKKLRDWEVMSPIYIETTIVDTVLVENFHIEKKVSYIRQKKMMRILFLARIEQAKGIFETVDAIKILCDKNLLINLSIAGDGPARKQLVTYIKSVSLPPDRINFLGYVRGEQKTSVFANHDIYCFPTYYREGLPIAVLEALAFGMPVITCAVGGLADIFRDGEMGALVPQRNPEAIARKIEQMISDRESLAHMAQHNHTYAKENFLAPKVATRLLNIYQRTIKANNNDR